MRRLVITAAVGAAVVATAVPSLAAQTASTPKQSLPVGVTVSTKGGIFVGTTITGNPALSVAVANGQACVGFSLEIPVCVGVPPIIASQPAAPAPRAVPAPRQTLPPGGGPVIYHDDTRTAVGVGDVGVVIYSDGLICPVVSTQKWPCLQLG